MKYRKKPVVIEAIQYNNLNYDDIIFFVGRDLNRVLETETAYLAGQGTPKFSIIIPTLEGDMKAMPDDFIIRGVHGEFYPCKPDIFEKTYEPVSEWVIPNQVQILNDDTGYFNRKIWKEIKG